METFGEQVRRLRTKKRLPLRTVAGFLDIDQAILSKIETGKRTASRSHVVRLADYFNVDLNELLVNWLSDKLVYELKDEDIALEALKIAEEVVAYRKFQKVDRQKLIDLIKETVKKFPKIEKAWIYGSFSRGDDGPNSDIDIAIKASEQFTYFDLAEVQYRLESIIDRKIDVGFIDSFKPYVFEHVKPELKVIYEK
ncbi:MAG: nucleotidyltransferase domain-containing protein [Bacteroidales bacterium]|nr:nucleotidyltransferase domain-containing protein [Bacteroidales bacterium]